MMRSIRKQQGFTLVEILVAMAILGVVSVGFIGGMTASSRAALRADQIDTGRAIAQAQIEWVKGQSFLSSGAYTTNDIIMAQYPGYSVAIAASTASQRDAFIQKITVTVSHNGAVVKQLQDCKVKK
jgi:prepilin-type N-terminal cleavage/methylation domain-containing protein